MAIHVDWTDDDDGVLVQFVIPADIKASLEQHRLTLFDFDPVTMTQVLRYGSVMALVFGTVQKTVVKPALKDWPTPTMATLRQEISDRQDELAAAESAAIQTPIG